MSNFVLDASIALGWAVDNPEPDGARKVRELFRSGQTAVVPSLWVLEVANGLIMAERRGKIDAVKIEQARKLYEAMMAKYIEVQPDLYRGAFREIQDIAKRVQLTAYDAYYVFMAAQLSLPLATLDRSLIASARRLGIGVLS